MNEDQKEILENPETYLHKWLNENSERWSVMIDLQILLKTVAEAARTDQREIFKALLKSGKSINQILDELQ